MTTIDERPWWGKYPFSQGETACWRIGGLHLWVQRAPREWHLAGRLESASETTVEWRLPCEMGLPADPAFVHHYGFRHPGERMVLEPRVADRPLVWRPQQPLSVAPGEEATLYLRSPLWLAFRADGCDKVLWESSVLRLSDTWIGAPTEDGGYAYSVGREFFLEGDQVPRDAVHAITPMVIRNSTDALLHLERLNLPMPYLSLFVCSGGGVWTQKVTLERDEEDEELALLRIGKGAPQEAGKGQLLAGPRVEAETNLVFQAFRRLFR